MANLDFEKELVNINEMKSVMKEMGVSYADVPKTLSIDNRLRVWFNARKHSLLTGYLEDSDVKFYALNGFDFGVKLLLWEDWCQLLKCTLKELHTDYIGEKVIADKDYLIGKWAKKQSQNWDMLSINRKIALVDSGFKIKCLYESRSPFNMKITYNDIEFSNAIDFFRAINVSLMEVFEDINKWGKKSIQRKVEEYGGFVNNISIQRVSNEIFIDKVITKKELEGEEVVEEEISPKKEERFLRYEDLQKNLKAEQASVVRNKLKEFSDEYELDEFMQLISNEYMQLIAKNQNYPTLSEFEKTKIKRMFDINKYVAWKEEKNLSIWNNNKKKICFYTYGICDFGYGFKELKRISIEIMYDNNELFGGFYSDDEEYIHLSSVEIKNLLKSMLKRFSVQFDKFEREQVYIKIKELIYEVEMKGKIVGKRKADDVISVLSEPIFEWEKDDGNEILDMLYENPVYIKKIKKSFDEEQMPDVYMASYLKTFSFEPHLDTKYILYLKIYF